MPGPRTPRRARYPSGKQRAPRSMNARRSPRPRGPRRAKKAAAPGAQESDEGEAVRHYGDAWEYEHYEKESHKAKGLFL